MSRFFGKKILPHRHCWVYWRKVIEVEIFFQKYILTLQPNGEPLTFAFFFIFLGICVLFNFSILKMDCWFCRMLGICIKGQGCAALLHYGLRWLMEWRCNGVEGLGADESSDRPERNASKWKKRPQAYLVPFSRMLRLCTMGQGCDWMEWTK